MKPASGKLRKDDDTVLDVSAILTKLDGVLDAVNGLKVNATLEVGDIEIGAVELKDATTDTRAEIAAANAGNTTSTNVVKMQPVDESGNVIMGGAGGSAGGGNNTYSTEQGDFTATVTDATTNIVLSTDSVGGVAITAANFANAILKVWDASTEEMVQITLDDFTWTAGTKTLAVANCTGAFTFATGNIVSLTIVGPDKMRDSSTDAQRNSPIRDISDQYVGETLATLTNIAANTTGYLYFTMDGYKTFAIQCATSDATPTDTLTLTVEASWQDDGTADSSCDYDDVTTAWFGVASVVDTDTVFDMSDACSAKYVRLKYVTSNTGGSDADLTAYLKRKY